MYRMRVDILPYKGAVKGFTIDFQHLANLGGFCIPCCRFSTHPNKVNDKYRVLQCEELRGSSQDICDAYFKHGRCGHKPTLIFNN